MIGKSDLGHDLELTFQISDVHKTLAAVSKISRAGNRVVFDEEGSYIYNKASGLSTPMHPKNGIYFVHIWVLVPKVSSGRFEALTEEEEEPMQVFLNGA